MQGPKESSKEGPQEDLAGRGHLETRRVEGNGDHIACPKHHCREHALEPERLLSTLLNFNL